MVINLDKRIYREEVSGYQLSTVEGFVILPCHSVYKKAHSGYRVICNNSYCIGAFIK